MYEPGEIGLDLHPPVIYLMPFAMERNDVREIDKHTLATPVFLSKERHHKPSSVEEIELRLDGIHIQDFQRDERIDNRKV